jgi:hypothetical protein
LEWIGNYDPMVDPPTFALKEERAAQWLSKGAQPSDAVRRILDKVGILDRIPQQLSSAPKPKTGTVQGTTNVAIAAPVAVEEVADEAPADEARVDEAPADEAPADEAPADEASVDEASVDEASVDEASVDEAPADEAPADEAPVDEASADEAPADEAPAEEAPDKASEK